MGEPGTWRFGARLFPAFSHLRCPEAAALSARVRWLPSTDPRVVGYEVHVRPAGGPYGTAIDVGAPVAYAAPNESTGPGAANVGEHPVPSPRGYMGTMPYPTHQ